MKWFLITLAIGLAASDKLDRTYLPPPGAHLAGGILGSHDAPLEPPHHPHSEPGPVIGGQGAQPNFGLDGEPVNFGDKIPKVPVTTTSYAFSQTTTYPPGEGFDTTTLPINPVTGLPIQLEQGLQNFPFVPSQGQQNVQNLPGYTHTQAPTYGTNIQPSFTTSQAPTYGANIQPGFGVQGPTSAPVNIGSPGYDQFANQPLNQYQGQNVITPGGAPQIPGSVYPGNNQGQLQYPGGLSNTQELLPTGTPDNQRLDQYLGQNVVNPGGVVKIPDSNQGLVQYPGGQTVTGQQGVISTTESPINLQPGGKQSGVNYDGSQGPISQGTYSGQPINEQNLGGTQPTQSSYQNQEPISIGGIPSQYPTGSQNYGSTVPTGSENVYQPGSTPSTIPSTYINGISSTTPYLGATSSTSSYPSVRPVYRPERPQAAADRNAVILNYENVRTPNGYSYSFDTSNGIHADESGKVDNGTKAQGSYSYIGDDGKVYSVVYTADENGFQPRGDHLPTSPPIPEAIQRVIEQAARDKAAGIVHDGSYDEAKYGDHNYNGNVNHRRPQNQDTNQFDNNQFNGVKDGLKKPISGIKDEKYNEGVTKDQFNNNLPIKDTQKGLNEKLAPTRPSNQRNGENNVHDVSVGNGRVSGDFHSPRGDFDGNRMPIAENKINQSSNYGAKKQKAEEHRPDSRGNNFPSHRATDSDENNLPGPKNRRPSEYRPISGGVKDVIEKYPGSNVDVGTTDKSATVGDGFYNGEGRDIDSGIPNVADGSGENININYNSVTGAPMENKIQTLRQRIKGNRRPDLTGNRSTQNNNGRLQDEAFSQKSTEMPSFSDYFKKGIANQQATKQDDNGYHYQQPNTKFEQNTFPTRFSPQEVHSTQPDQRRTEYVEGTTRKPFMTPNVYHQNNSNNQSTPNVNNQDGNNGQSTPNRYNENKSTTRRPYTTPFNTDNSYSDYDDGDYVTDQDVGDDRIQSTRKPSDTPVTSRPYQSTQITLTPKNVPSGHRTRVDQKDTVTPGRRTENSGTESAGYTYRPTTHMPSHNSRFGNTEIPRRMKPQERRPTNPIPVSTTAVGRPVTTQSPSDIEQPDYKYRTTGPNFKYPDANVGSGYPTTGSFPGAGSRPPGESTPRDYYSSTYGPTEDYFSTTATPPTSGYTQGSVSQVPSGTPGSYQPPQDKTFHTGYHYGPPKTGSLNLDGPGFFTPSGTSGVFPTSPTGTYQTTYQQGPDGFPSTTFGPISPGSQNTFIPSQSGTFAPETLTGTYPGNYQNGPSTPDYDTTIVSSTPGGKPIFVYPGSPGAQETTGYEYGPTRPTYSTTESPSIIGTTPGSFIPTGSVGPTQDYTTTYHPGFQPTQDSFVGGPVDGFGRPIVTDQGGSHPGLVHLTHGPTGPINNVGSNFDDQTRVIGEDFSGPKQHQRFDPQTGYHYK